MNTQDQIVVTALGVTGILFISNVSQAPFVYALDASLVFIAAVILYAQLSRKFGAKAKHVKDAAAGFKLADAFAEAILTIGEHREIINANSAAEKLFSLKVHGMPYTQVLSQPDIISMIDEALNGNTPAPVHYQVETPVLRHMRVTASPIDTSSNPYDEQRIIVVFYDITEFVIANTLRSDFLANASHELKTPVASILGYIETLRGHAKNDEEARNRFLIIMQQQAERMQRLITDLLSLRRIEQKAHIAPATRGDFYLAAKAARESLAPFAKERNISISFKNKLKLLVTGDQDELVQIVLNLVDNAVKMSPPGSKVKLSFERVSKRPIGDEFSREPLSPAAPRQCIVDMTDAEFGFAVLRIRDQGPGFEAEHLPRLGERFYRIMGDRSSGEKGTGLGLAIVKHIVRTHRGGLFVESARGVGTEFSIFIPLAPYA